MSKAINTPESNSLPHPNVKDSRVKVYLNVDNKTDNYVNTVEENELVNLWKTKYGIAVAEYEKSRSNSQNVKIWRDAYEGIIYKIDENGNITTDKVKPLRRLAYELIEDKINPRIPAPKMSPRYHADLVPVNATEQLIKHEMDRMLSEVTHNESEHSTLIDSASWFKVSWDPFDNTHERSGMPKVEVCPIDTVFPQPGVYDYRRLEYIFEKGILTVAQCYDLFNRKVTSTENNDLVNIVTVYYLNEDRHLGRFIWVDDTLQVLANDLEWGIRKRRECTKCHRVVPFESECPVCGSKKMHYVPVTKEIVTEDIVMVKNPYRNGESQNTKDDVNQLSANDTISAGTEIPHYLIRQLPFVPRTNVKLPRSLYGISEVELIVENQEESNRFLNKASRKSAASKTYITKMRDTAVTNENDELSFLDVDDASEVSAIQPKQVLSDINQEMAMAETLYNYAKSTTGITDTDQGKQDATARSGKAKQIQLAASEQRKQSPNVMRDAAYAGVYELIFKFMLAFSDEERSFVSLLPDGTQREEVWSKYMFLNRDSNGDFYYRDDFAWSVDSASDITQDRMAMWQLIDQDYLNGTMGNEIDPVRAMKMYWQMKEQFGYPTAKFALAFINDSVKHLPTQIEQLLVNNPEALQMALSFIQDTQKAAMGGGSGTAVPGMGAGGARPNSGPDGNGATHAANVQKTNNKNRANAGNAQTSTSSAKTGTIQGGTGGVV